MTAAGTSGINISRSDARSMRRAASRCAPQMANAIFASSEGCMENPANTNQPREPLASLPIPGMSTRTSMMMVIANPLNAMPRAEPGARPADLGGRLGGRRIRGRLGPPVPQPGQDVAHGRLPGQSSYGRGERVAALAIAAELVEGRTGWGQ